MNALDWRDALVIAGLLLAVIAGERVYEASLFARERRRTTTLIRSLRYGDSTYLGSDTQIEVGEVDHEPCTSCGHVICFCTSPGECEGCVNVGCLHLTWIGQLCADCRSECVECRFEDHADRALDIARGK